jgi:hypothetical protein
MNTKTKSKIAEYLAISLLTSSTAFAQGDVGGGGEVAHFKALSITVEKWVDESYLDGTLAHKLDLKTIRAKDFYQGYKKALQDVGNKIIFNHDPIIINGSPRICKNDRSLKTITCNIDEWNGPEEKPTSEITRFILSFHEPLGVASIETNDEADYSQFPYSPNLFKYLRAGQTAELSRERTDVTYAMGRLEISQGRARLNEPSKCEGEVCTYELTMQFPRFAGKRKKSLNGTSFPRVNDFTQLKDGCYLNYTIQKSKQMGLNMIIESARTGLEHLPADASELIVSPAELFGDRLLFKFSLNKLKLHNRISPDEIENELDPRTDVNFKLISADLNCVQDKNSFVSENVLNFPYEILRNHFPLDLFRTRAELKPTPTIREYLDIVRNEFPWGPQAPSADHKDALYACLNDGTSHTWVYAEDPMMGNQPTFTIHRPDIQQYLKIPITRILRSEAQDRLYLQFESGKKTRCFSTETKLEVADCGLDDSLARIVVTLSNEFMNNDYAIGRVKWQNFSAKDNEESSQVYSLGSGNAAPCVVNQKLFRSIRTK